MSNSLDSPLDHWLFKSLLIATHLCFSGWFYFMFPGLLGRYHMAVPSPTFWSHEQKSLTASNYIISFINNLPRRRGGEEDSIQGLCRHKPGHKPGLRGFPYLRKKISRSLYSCVLLDKARTKWPELPSSTACWGLNWPYSLNYICICFHSLMLMLLRLKKSPRLLCFHHLPEWVGHF